MVESDVAWRRWTGARGTTPGGDWWQLLRLRTEGPSPGAFTLAHPHPPSGDAS